MPSFELPAVSCLLLPPTMHALANAFYREHGSAMKARDVHQVWAARLSRTADAEHTDPAAIVACACLQPISGADGHWLTSLFVAPQVRNRGLAGRLLKHLRQAEDGSIWLFCRPELTELYVRHGYCVATRLPESLASKLTRYQRDKQLVALVNHPTRG